MIRGVGRVRGEGRDALGPRAGQRARARGRRGSQLGIHLSLEPVVETSFFALGDALGDASRARRLGVRVGRCAESREDLGVGRLDDVRVRVVLVPRVAERGEPDVEIFLRRLEARLFLAAHLASGGGRALERRGDDPRCGVDISRDTLTCGRHGHRRASDATRAAPSGRQRRRREHADRGPDDHAQHPNPNHHRHRRRRAEQLADDAPGLLGNVIA